MPTALRNRKKSSRAICQRRRIGDNRRSPQSNDKDVLDAPTLAPGILRRALLPVPSAGPGCRRKRNPRPVPALAGRPRAAQRQGPGRGLCAAPGLLWPRADARAHPLRQAGLLRPPSRLRAAHRRCAADRAERPGRPLRGALRQAGTPRRTPAQLSGAAPGRARRAWRYLALRRRERRDHPLRRRPALHPAGSRPLRRYRGGLRLGSGPRAEQRRLVRRIRGLPLRPLERRRARPAQAAGQLHRRGAQRPRRPRRQRPRAPATAAYLVDQHLDQVVAAGNPRRPVGAGAAGHLHHLGRCRGRTGAVQGRPAAARAECW